MKICVVDDCDKQHHSFGYCLKHAARWKRNGAPITVRTANTYSSAHFRVRRVRGKASNFLCVDCGGKAAQWAYDHGDPNEKTEFVNGHWVAFSLDPANYKPMCVSCHVRFDKP